MAEPPDVDVVVSPAVVLPDSVVPEDPSVVTTPIPLVVPVPVPPPEVVLVPAPAVVPEDDEDSSERTSSILNILYAASTLKYPSLVS